MVSESLLWPFLSSLVFLSVTSFLSLHASAITTAAVASCRWTSDVIQSSSLGSGPATAVVKKFHTAQTTALCITAANIAPISFLKVLLRSSSADLHIRGYLAAIWDCTRPHAPLKDFAAPPRDATSALAASVSTDLLTSSPRHLQPLTVDIDQSLIVDRWSLTVDFLVDFFPPARFSLPSFSCRFRFCSQFLHIVSLNG